MADWLVEEGIGEHRAVRIERDRIVAAQVAWAGELAAGTRVAGVLSARAKGSPRGTGRLPDGEDVLIDRLPATISEGSAITIEIVRAAIGEPGRLKRALGRVVETAPTPAPSLVERLREQGHDARVVRRFPVPGWSELVLEALSGKVAFDGGSLDLFPAPAMTLIDVDGASRPLALSLACAPAIAETLNRMAIGGAVGIDFPTLTQKADRKAVDAALEAGLVDWPHERTAMNGFGFVHLVARASGPSILQRARWRPRATAARLLLRAAETVPPPGRIVLTAKPTVLDAITAQWCDDLARRTGRPIETRADATLALEGGFAQAVAS